MEEKKMMVEEKKKERTKEEKNKEEEGKKGFKKKNLSKGLASEKKENNPSQCLIWFSLNGLGSSQNSQNSLNHNWCIGGCWFTQAMKRHLFVLTLWQVS
jgi:hypothetical protein